MVKESKETKKMIDNMYNFDNTAKLIELIKTMDYNHEFEVSINRLQGINLTQYMDTIKYLINRATITETNLIQETTLDVIYNYDTINANVYRITISDIDKINKLMSKLSIRKNHSIFSILTNNIINQTKNEIKYMKLINKIKDISLMIDNLEYDLRFRLSQENEITDNIILNDLINLSEQERNKIRFRFKERLSYIIKHDNFDIRIDLTSVKQHMYINKLEDSNYIYELEIELIKTNKKQLNEIAYSELLLEIYKIQQLLQKSNKVISLTMKNIVKRKMKQLLFDNPDNNTKDLAAMQSQSLENQHVASDLTTQYSVTDKADGDRFFMFIMDGNIYLISNNLEVKEIENNIYSELVEYNDTILDGEYIYIKDDNKYIYLAFDILFYKGNNMRDDVKLENRLIKLNDVLKKCFKTKILTEKYNESTELNIIIEYYNNQIIEWFIELNNKLKKDTNIIMGKLFFVPLGLYSTEIYKYSDMVWSNYTNNPLIKCPYVLDGLIYTPLNQKYTKDLKEIKYQIYKWKPSSHNSIDFYIKFERNMETQQLLNVYDNSIGKNIDESFDNKNFQNDENKLDDVSDYKVGDKIYRICNLYVGSTKTGIEQPTLFGKENNLFLAYLYVNNDEVRDIEGNILQDETVVEFAYNNNPLLEHPYRWVPLRTRLDKTESVIKYKKKYGNNEFIADKVWRSIISPFDLIDIKMLADESEHENYMKNVIKSRITKADIVKERSENMYYQIISNLARPMRDFHNFIKSNLIYTYCSKKKINLNNNKFKSMDVLDIAIGRGGDLLKFYHSRVNKLVGFDIDANGIYSATDGVISRYQTMKRKMPNFPKAIFLIADSTALLNAESQEKSLGYISDINKITLESVFGKNENDNKFDKFDVINCQFMLHFLFKNDQSWNNFCANVNKYLNKDGYIIITTSDGKLLHDSFVDNKITHFYTDNGKKKIMFEYKKLYSDTNIKKTGLAIDFYNAMFNIENTYNTEYIIDPEFLISELKEKCNLKLLETDSFENQFNILRYFFENVAIYEANEKTKNYFMKIKEFYNFNDDINKNSFELTKLNRYFVFQKL